MRAISLQTVAVAAVMALPAGAAFADGHALPGGQVIVPESSIEWPEDIGQRFHTNYEIFLPTGGMAGLTPHDAARLASRRVAPDASVPQANVPWYETPASLNCVYSLAVPSPAGCNPWPSSPMAA